MKQKDILIIIILLFIFILSWIGSNIYHSAVNSTIPETTSKDMLPISPVFDTKTIEELKKREQIIPVFELGSISPTPIVIPTLKVTPKSASEGAKLLL